MAKPTLEQLLLDGLRLLADGDAAGAVRGLTGKQASNALFDVVGHEFDGVIDWGDEKPDGFYNS